MKNQKQLQGLYAITNGQSTPARSLKDRVEQALSGGASIIQYRDKSADPVKRRQEATALLACCRQHNVPLIINDDIELAAAVGADGVHLGQDDAQIATARARLDGGSIIGVSCYDQLSRAKTAQDQGANYVAFGRFFPSNSKPDASPASLTTLEQAAQILDIPIVAIGGITPENGPLLIRAGADMLAAIHAVFAQPDIAAAAAQFSQLFECNEDFSS